MTSRVLTALRQREVMRQTLPELQSEINLLFSGFLILEANDVIKVADLEMATACRQRVQERQCHFRTSCHS